MDVVPSRVLWPRLHLPGGAELHRWGVSEVFVDTEPALLADLSDLQPATRHSWRSHDRNRYLLSVPLQSAGRDNGSASTKSICLLNTRSVANKSHILNDLFIKNKFDFLFVTETWQQNSDFIHLNELCPVDCSVIGIPRLSGRRGGLAVLRRNLYPCKLVSSELFPSFELKMIKVGQLKPFYCILTYRPLFFSDFTDLMSSLIKFENLSLLGDFNLHIDDAGNRAAIDFLNFVESHNLIQHFNEPTHSGGHTLDLVLSLGLDVSSIHCEDMLITDHKCLF